MREIIIISMLGVDLLFACICIVCFCLLYGEKIKRYNLIRNNYTYSISVKCIQLDSKKMNRNDANWAEGYGGNTRVHYDVERPYFQGIINGKTYTFVRTKDIHQPVCEEGKNYTIFLQNLNDIDCSDFYESNEIAEMNTLVREKKKKYFALIGLCLVIAIVLLIMML